MALSETTIAVQPLPIDPLTLIRQKKRRAQLQCRPRFRGRRPTPVIRTERATAVDSTDQLDISMPTHLAVQLW